MIEFSEVTFMTEYMLGNTKVIVHRPEKRMTDEEMKQYNREVCIEALKNDRAKRAMRAAREAAKAEIR